MGKNINNKVHYRTNQKINFKGNQQYLSKHYKKVGKMKQKHLYQVNYKINHSLNIELLSYCKINRSINIKV